MNEKSRCLGNHGYIDKLWSNFENWSKLFLNTLEINLNELKMIKIKIGNAHCYTKFWFLRNINVKYPYSIYILF